MLESLRELVCRLDHWSRNYEYKIEGVTDTKISSSINYNPISTGTVASFIFGIYLITFFLPENINSIILYIYAPFLFFDIQNNFLAILSTLITFYLYITLITWILNKFDFYRLKNIIWKSSLVTILYLSIFFSFGFFSYMLIGEYRIFNIELFWIVLPIFVIIFIYLESVLEPTFITTITELLRQRDSNLISKETFIKIRDSLLSVVDDTNIPEESKKIIKDYISS